MHVGLHGGKVALAASAAFLTLTLANTSVFAQSATATATVTATRTATAMSSVRHDERFFAQTGYRIDNDTIWDYFNRRGGVTSFGYPTSRQFMLQGFQVQFFQRRISQLDTNGRARLLNLLDPGLLPYANYNGSTFPGVDSALVASAPDPRDQPKTLQFVRDHAPDTFNGKPVNFHQTFIHSVSAQTAFPNNNNFIYLRFQRGIMHYEAGCKCTRGILLADYLKAILTGQNLPTDVAQESKDSAFYKQYDPSQPKSIRNPSQLRESDLTHAFTQQ